jgi:hypothetical protein
MKLYDELSESLDGLRGLQMRDILKKACSSGVSREEALDILMKLYQKTERENNEAAQDLIVDFIDILNFRGHPDNYIWPSNL